MTAPTEQHHCGYCALVGRPNVGKSTLMNALLGQKLSITAAKPQTTRHRIMGIKTRPEGQLIFIDTPGIHDQTEKAINRYLNRTALAVLQDVDVVVWMVVAGQWTAQDRAVGRQLRELTVPLIIAINKVDLLSDKSALLPQAEQLQQDYAPVEIVMLSARSGTGVAEFEQCLLNYLPLSRPYYDEATITDRSERFLAAEFVREQVTRCLHQELPYATTVEIEAFERESKIVRISAVIWVERSGQKGIVIGHDGAMLKRIGAQARQQLERLFDSRVYLRLWVKVKTGWSDDERALRSFGYAD